MADLTVRRIADPQIHLTVSICTSEHQPMSEPAIAVHQVLLGLIESFATTNRLPIPTGTGSSGAGSPTDVSTK